MIDEQTQRIADAKRALANAQLRLEWEESGRAFVIEAQTCGGDWLICDNPSWQNCVYRRRPEKRWRPWTAEEAIGKVVKARKGNLYLVITRVENQSIYAGAGGYIDPTVLFDAYVQLDGSPAGAEEEG